MKINKVHCLFEQSGTFKNEFRKLGICAEDYDIQNDFGETDHVVDLFAEIDKAYDGKPSLFDGIGECDLVFAFFPCTRFEAKVPLCFRGQLPQYKKYTDEEKLANTMKLHDELHDLYTLICKLFSICLRGGVRMIVENPYTQPHYLTMYFPIQPKIIDADRTKNGDHYRKPTQYWFVNCEPEQNVIVKPIEETEILAIQNVQGKDRRIKRSLIHPQYAERFIKSYVLDAEGGVWEN